MVLEAIASCLFQIIWISAFHLFKPVMANLWHGAPSLMAREPSPQFSSTAYVCVSPAGKLVFGCLPFMHGARRVQEGHMHTCGGGACSGPRAHVQVAGGM